MAFRLSTFDSGLQWADDRLPLRAIMESINQADEYRRLQELYAEMSDAQIDAMSAEMEDLTEIAQHVLRAEISKRGLGPRGLDAPEDPREATRRAMSEEISGQEPEGQEHDGANRFDDHLRDPFPKGLDPAGYDLTPVWTAGGPSEAREVMSLLDSAGIKAYLGPRNVESVDDYQGSYEQGVKIKVMKFQAEFATSGLRRFAASKPEQDSGDDADYAVFCPSCNSREVIFQGLDVEEGKEPAPEAKYNWTCAACGHEWKDDGIEKTA